MHNLTNLKSWNIKFNGDTCVYDFLTRVEEARAAKDVDISIVLRGFSEFLQGTALQFYRQIKTNITSWDDLCTQFKTNFQPVDFEFKTDKLIRTTYQQANQTVFAYITHIKDLNSKLQTPIQGNSLLEIIKHNLLPDYTPLLANSVINSLEKLITLSRNYEAYSKKSQVFKSQPNTPYQNKNTTYSDTTNHRTPSPEICKKCNRRGHNYKQCRTVKGTLCFICRTPDVLTHSCPKCNKNNKQKPHTPKTIHTKKPECSGDIKTFQNHHNISPDRDLLPSDNRLYVNFNIQHYNLVGMLDTGANTCVLGKNFHTIFNKSYTIQKTYINATSADGSALKVIGTITMPVLYDGVEKTLDFLIIPSVDKNIILGMNFLYSFKLLNLFALKTNLSAQTSSGIRSNSPNISVVQAIVPRHKLPPHHSKQINKIIDKFKEISFEQVGLGKTNLIRHRIRTEAHQ